MAKFLRKVRQRLLAENKISKYFMYAIGEIILVVIGILIALSVNNRNNRRIDDDRVDRLKEKLKVQLNYNLATVNDEIESSEIRIERSMQLLSIIGDTTTANHEAEIDSLIIFNSYDSHLNLDMNVITASRENGDLALISNDSLSQSVYNIITLYTRILADEKVINSNLNNQFLGYLTENYNLKNLIHRYSDDESWETSKIYKGDNNKILTDQKFENLVSSRIILHVELLETYVNLREIMERTITLL